MTSTTRRASRALGLVLIALLAAGCTTREKAAPVPAAPRPFVIGLGDQKPEMFADSRFTNLGLRHVRLVVPWDAVARGGPRLARLDAWLAAARAANADVLVAFNHSDVAPRRLPSVAAFRRAVALFRRRYPHVVAFSVWNEANHRSQPTARHPRRAAQYYNAMRRDCAGCRLVAADVLDQRGLETWLAQFKRTARTPRLWGLHNYVDANRRRGSLAQTSTARFLRLVPGEIWLTEAGGIVRFGSAYRGDERRAAESVKRTFALARLSPRIRRVYLYQWSADPVFYGWDSGLVAADGRLRPGYHVLRAAVQRQRRGSNLAPLPPIPLYSPPAG